MWETFIVNPMINALLWFYGLFGDFIVAIAVFTIIIRLITLPLNLRQQRSMMKTQEMQPQVQAIQKKYRDNPQKMQEEFRKIGYNPAESLTGCLPTLLQFPILIGLYQAIVIVLGTTPQSLFELKPRVYPAINLTSLIPVDNQYLWLNLDQPDPFFILPILVVATMFLQQKLLAPPARPTTGQEENPAAAMTQSMQYTMPLMFGFFSLQFPSGLSIYFILSNLIGIAQGLYMRWHMNREKEAMASKPKVVEGTVVDASAESAVTKSVTASNGSSAKSSKSTKATTSPSSSSTTTKRKKRSAKR
jgi:YidC/Oxa1 family membrane protein insertase